MKLTRRHLIAGGLAGGALLTLGGIGLGLRGTRMRAPRRTLTVLSPEEFSILAAVADRVSAPADGFPTPWELEVPERLDHTLSTLHPADAAEFVSVLWLLENALVGALFEGRFTTFSASSDDVQDAVLRSWQRSAFTLKRTAYKAVAGMCGGTYWGSPAVHPLVGYTRRTYGQQQATDAEVHWRSPRYLPPGTETEAPTAPEQAP